MYRRELLRALSASGAACIGLSIAGCVGLGSSGTTPVNVDGTRIEMTDDDRYEPDAITVPVGARLVWRTVGYAPHTVTAYEDELPPEAAYFASGGFPNEAAARNGASEGDGLLERGAEYAHTFEVPGTYHYCCIPHEQVGMTGTVTVEPTAASGPEASGQ